MKLTRKIEKGMANPTLVGETILKYNKQGMPQNKIAMEVNKAKEKTDKRLLQYDVCSFLRANNIVTRRTKTVEKLLAPKKVDLSFLTSAEKIALAKEILGIK